jgi:nicotinamidase-related amidase
LTLDPKTTALVLIDLQRGTVARELTPHSAVDVVRSSVSLADTMRAQGATIVFVRADVAQFIALPVDAPVARPDGPPPKNASDLVAETNRQPGDILVTKRQWGAFYGTQLDQELRRRGIRTIVFAGIATNFGVESTARAAFDRGYELVFAEDAMSGLTAGAHAFAMASIFPRMGRVRSSQDIAAAIGS